MRFIFWYYMPFTDTTTQELVYSSAGLNAQPLLIKKNGDISEIEIRGLPICNLMELCKPDYTDNTIRLESGDRVFFLHRRPDRSS